MNLVVQKESSWILREIKMNDKHKRKNSINISFLTMSSLQGCYTHNYKYGSHIQCCYSQNSPSYICYVDTHNSRVFYSQFQVRISHRCCYSQLKGFYSQLQVWITNIGLLLTLSSTKYTHWFATPNFQAESSYSQLSRTGFAHNFHERMGLLTTFYSQCQGRMFTHISWP